MRLVIESKLRYSSFYVTDIKQEVTYIDHNLTDNREIIKRKLIRNSLRSVNRCFDYETIGCGRQHACIGRCFTNALSRQTNKILLAYFSLQNYTEFLYHSIVVRDLKEVQYVKNCLKIYSMPDCKKIYFENDKTHIEYAASNKRLILPVHFRTIINEELETGKFYDWFSVIVNIVNIYSVLVGINVDYFFKLILKLAELKYRLTAFRRKSYGPIRVLFFIGFFFHVKFVYEHTFESDLRNSLIIELKPHLLEPYEIPEINLCFDYDDRLNEHSFNANYLENMTSDIRIDTVFDTIVYLNEEGEPIVWTPGNDGGDNEILSFDHFYFLNKKCLKVVYRFDRVRKFSSNEKHPLKFILNRALNRTYFHFCSNPIGKRMLSKLNRLSYTNYYDVFLDKIHLSYNDVFVKYKNLYLWYKDIKFKQESFAVQLREEFIKASNHTTRWFPLTRDLFEYPINDTLFETFYEDYQKLNGKFFSSNFELEYTVDNILIEKLIRQNFSLKFNSEHLLTTNEIEREENLISFLVSAFSAISLWFSLSPFQILDLFFGRAIQFIKRQTHYLSVIKCFLKRYFKNLKSKSKMLND